jgi:hypothetical protein
MIKDTNKYWTETATNLLKGRKIVRARYLTNKEAETLGWDYRCVVIELDNGLMIYPSMDDEGNNAGALFTTDPKVQTLPVLDL